MFSGLALAGILCTYCMNLIVENSASLASTMTTGEYLSYSKLTHHAFYRSSFNFISRNAFTAQVVVDVFIFCTQISACSAYWVFVCKNLAKVTQLLFLFVLIQTYVNNRSSFFTDSRKATLSPCGLPSCLCYYFAVSPRSRTWSLG